MARSLSAAFIGVVGTRYGWRPNPSRIPEADFDALLGAGPDDADARAMVGEWYFRDENAVPPAYVLHQRCARAVSSLST